ncbi:MAG: ABC transporter ATP-binding protein [Egibacteraceae bacterium]
MLEVTGLTVAYGRHVAVDDVDLDAARGEVVCVLGPSGCGKSTLLRAIAGLEPPVAGRIALDGRDVTAARPDERHVGLMFQEHVLFPHRSVGENVAFGPRMRGAGPAEIDRAVAESLSLVDLDGFADRPVSELSGGEQQRVALARAIAPRPRLLMLDEPLGSLDRALRDRLLTELPRLFATLGTTVLYVTHDQEEALSLADRVAVMRDGRFAQVGAPEAVWRHPADGFVARFLGHEPILAATVRGGVAATALADLPVAADDGDTELVLLPGAVSLAADAGDPAGPKVSGEVTARRFAGDRVVATVATDAGVSLEVGIWRAPAPALGERVDLAIDPAEVAVLPAGDRAC